MSTASYHIEASAVLELMELQQAGLRITEPRASSHRCAHEEAVSSLVRGAAEVRLDGEAMQDGPAHNCRESVFCGDDDDTEEGLAMQDLLELQRCGPAVRLTRIRGHATASCGGRSPGAG